MRGRWCARCPRGGFSLLELVIVVAILGVIAALALTRAAGASDGASDSALASNLAALRKAVDLYRADHGRYPDLVAAESTAGKTLAGKATADDQLTNYTDDAGTVSKTRTAVFRHGPYLREVPRLGVGARRDRTKIGPPEGAGVGWAYDPATGEIRPNTLPDETDARGIPYARY